jgi:2-C-methyl-D-erythritol 4-phosphate cytidylyltransferase
MSNWAIIVAAGKSVRFGDALPKQFHNVAGKPLLAWTIAAFENARLIDEIVVVLSAEFQFFVKKDVIDQYKFMKVSKVITGGKNRQSSVFNALKSLPGSTNIVVIHDGVRPLILSADIDRVVAAAEKHKAAMIAVPVKETVKQVEGNTIIKSLERDKIWLAQTPQAFEYNLILEAHEKFSCEDSNTITDDSLLVEKKGIPVRVIEPSGPNTKVTTPEDMAYVETVLRMRSNG